jgi:hypothetical protein
MAVISLCWGWAEDACEAARDGRMRMGERERKRKDEGRKAHPSCSSTPASEMSS